MDFNLEDSIVLLSLILRFVGLLIFGLGSGWFTLHAFRQPDKNSYLQIWVYLGFLGFTAYLTTQLTAGALGGYVLGAGLALILWGLRPVRGSDDE